MCQNFLSLRLSNIPLNVFITFHLSSFICHWTFGLFPPSPLPLLFLATPWHVEFPGQVSDLSHSWNLHCSYGNTGSLTHCARPGGEPVPQPQPKPLQWQCGSLTHCATRTPGSFFLKGQIMNISGFVGHRVCK